MKTCVKCEKEFPNSYFYIRPDNNVQYTHCKNCIGEYIKEWRFNNSDKTNKSRAMLKKKRRDENLCRYCGSPRLENSSFCEIDWYKIKAYKNSGTAGNWKFLRELIKKQNYKCIYTGQLLVPGINASLDHIIPRSRQPSLQNDLKNLQWVDRDVNIIKRNMTHEEFVYLCKLITKNQ